MADFSARLAEVLFVERLDGEVLVAAANRAFLVDFIQRLHSVADRFFVLMEGLATTVDTPTGAGHHFDEVQVVAAIANLLNERLLRPAMVMVAMAPLEESTEETTTESPDEQSDTDE